MRGAASIEEPPKAAHNHIAGRMKHGHRKFLVDLKSGSLAI